MAHERLNNFAILSIEMMSPTSVTLPNDLESVQRRFTKRLPGFKSHSYDDRCARLGIDRLELNKIRKNVAQLNARGGRPYCPQSHKYNHAVI